MSLANPKEGPHAHPQVLVGELFHLLLVQASQEELVLQLLCLLQGQQGSVRAGFGKALSNPQVHGDGLGNAQGDTELHSSC